MTDTRLDVIRHRLAQGSEVWTRSDIRFLVAALDSSTERAARICDDLARRFTHDADPLRTMLFRHSQAVAAFAEAAARIREGAVTDPAPLRDDWIREMERERCAQIVDAAIERNKDGLLLNVRGRLLAAVAAEIRGATSPATESDEAQVENSPPTRPGPSWGQGGPLEPAPQGYGPAEDLGRYPVPPPSIAADLAELAILVADVAGSEDVSISPGGAAWAACVFAETQKRLAALEADAALGRAVRDALRLAHKAGDGGALTLYSCECIPEYPRHVAVMVEKFRKHVNESDVHVTLIEALAALDTRGGSDV